MKIKPFLGTLLVVLIMIGMIGTTSYIVKNENEPHSIFPFLFPSDTLNLTKQITLEEIRKIEVQLIRLDLNDYSHLSTNIKDEISKSILESSQTFNIPPILIHAIIQIESEYRFNIDHPIVFIKGKKTNARGLGGIIWEYWGKRLITAGIAETDNDLYLPHANILAIGYILRVIINDELTKNRKNWLLRRIITQYYGIQSNEYESKIQKVTSNLWLKRITKEIEGSDFTVEVQDSIKRTE
jgi:hypothetical protein